MDQNNFAAPMYVQSNTVQLGATDHCYSFQNLQVLGRVHLKLLKGFFQQLTSTRIGGLLPGSSFTPSFRVSLASILLIVKSLVVCSNYTFGVRIFNTNLTQIVIFFWAVDLCSFAEFQPCAVVGSVPYARRWNCHPV